MLPSQYKWLQQLSPLPLMIQEALKEYGTVEYEGPKNNPKIMSWAKELGIESVYTADSVPWCGLFMAIVARRADKAVPKNPLWALNWTNFGTPGSQPCLGDVLTFVRAGGGHVSLYVGEDKLAYHVLGGNQSDQVNIMRIDKSRLYGVRRPEVKIAHSPVAKPYILSGIGALSINEK